MTTQAIEAPSFGAWHTARRCDPPCGFDLIADAQKARKRMTKRELLVEFERADEAWLDKSEWLSMTEHYLKDLEAHVRDVHGCSCDIYAEPDPAA